MKEIRPVANSTSSYDLSGRKKIICPGKSWWGWLVRYLESFASGRTWADGAKMNEESRHAKPTQAAR